MNEQPVQPTDQPSSNPPPTPPTAKTPSESDVRMWNMLCHLSALAGLVGVPFGNILGPLLIWQIKKDEIPSVVAHGKAALNFQITVTIAAVAVGLVAVVLMLVVIGVFLIPVAILIGLCGMIFAIIAGMKANEGKEYRYPYSFTFVE